VAWAKSASDKLAHVVDSPVAAQIVAFANCKIRQCLHYSGKAQSRSRQIAEEQFF